MSATEELAEETVRARYARGKAIEEALAVPPTPLDAALFGTDAPTMQMHRMWIQRPPNPEMLGGVAFAPEESPGLRERAALVAATPNPLRELAAALVELADEMDAHLVTPVGLTVSTTHEWSWGAFQRRRGYGDDRLAQVHVSAVGVSTEWVRRALAGGDAAPQRAGTEPA